MKLSFDGVQTMENYNDAEYESCEANPPDSAANKMLDEVYQSGSPEPIPRRKEPAPLLPRERDSESMQSRRVARALTPEARTALDQLNSNESSAPKLVPLTAEARTEFRHVAKDLESDEPEIREAALTKLLSGRRELYLPAILELRQEAVEGRRDQAAGTPTNIKDPVDLVEQCDRFLAGHMERAFDVKSSSALTRYLVEGRAAEKIGEKIVEGDLPLPTAIGTLSEQEIGRRIERITTLDQDKNGDLQMMRLISEKAPEMLSSSERRVLAAPVHERILLASDLAWQDPAAAIALLKQAVQRDLSSCVGALSGDFVAVCGKLDLRNEAELVKVLGQAERNQPPKPDWQKLMPNLFRIPK